MSVDAAAFAEAVLRLRERGMELALLEAKVLVDWGRRAEVLNAKDVVELAKLTQKYPTGGGIVRQPPLTKVRGLGWGPGLAGPGATG